MQGPFQHKVQISCALRYQGWAEVLKGNLERVLGEGRICLDPSGIGEGHSWVSRIQAGLRQAQFVVVLATPEAFVSSRVADAWESLLWTSPNWLTRRKRIHLVQLVSTPIPPLLDAIACTDFRDHDQAQYESGLKELLGGLTAHVEGRPLPTLPLEIEIPNPPAQTVPGYLRDRIVSWLEPWLRASLTRASVAGAMGLARNALDSHPSNACAASAGLVRATGDDDARAALERILRAVQGAFKEELEKAPEAAAELEELRAQVVALRANDGEAGLLRAFLDHHTTELQKGRWCDPGQEQIHLLDPLALKLRLLQPGADRIPATESQRPAVGEAMGIRELLSLTQEGYPGLTHRWLLRGREGSGKTMLLSHLAATVAGEDQPRWIPIFASLPSLASSHSSLLDRLVREMHRAGQPCRGLVAILDQLGREGGLLLLLDGLDEVPRQYRAAADELVRELSEKWPDSPIILTASSFGAASPADVFREVELLAFNRVEQAKLLALWFGRGDGGQGEEASRPLLQSLALVPELQPLLGNPLLLTLIASLFAAGGEIPKAPSELLLRLTDMLLAGGHRRGRQPVAGPELVRRALRSVAFDLTCDDLGSISLGDLEKSFQGPEGEKLRESMQPLLPWDHRARSFWEDIRQRTGLIAPLTGDASEWRFLHPCLRDSLVAEQLADLGETGWLEQARRLTNTVSRWAVPYALLADRVADADAFVKKLASSNRALALQVMAVVPGLEPKTREEVLELTSDRETRALILSGIPALLDAPQPALELIDRLRRETRDGEDLHHLHESVQKIATRWPTAGGECQRLLACFFNHIPEPPQTLFSRIETRTDGAVPYWVDIPSAFFTMGSPPEEAGRWADEGPQLDVDLTKDFRVAVTPVTNEQYQAFDPNHPVEQWEGVPPMELLRHPVTNISWQAAASFCRWLSTFIPGLRLPTEAEWEYVCRAGTQTTFWSGNKVRDLERVAWYRLNSDNRSHAVGEKPANPWGLYDVHGNVWEICADWYAPYRQGPVRAPRGPLVGKQRVCRGGSFRNEARHARAAVRLKRLPADRSKAVGFRLVRA